MSGFPRDFLQCCDSGRLDCEYLSQKVPFRSNEICNIYYGRLPADTISLLMPDLLPPLMFCTDGNVNNAIGTCHGDSGGPLIKK